MEALMDLAPRLVESELHEPKTEFAQGWADGVHDTGRCPASPPKRTYYCFD